MCLFFMGIFDFGRVVVWFGVFFVCSVFREHLLLRYFLDPPPFLLSYIGILPLNTNEYLLTMRFSSFHKPEVKIVISLTRFDLKSAGFQVCRL